MSIAFPNVSAVVDALGGRRAVAAALQVKETAVGNWIVWNKLPAKRYIAIRDMVAPNVVPDELWAMEPAAPVIDRVGAEA